MDNYYVDWKLHQKRSDAVSHRLIAAEDEFDLVSQKERLVSWGLALFRSGSRSRPGLDLALRQSQSTEILHHGIATFWTQRHLVSNHDSSLKIQVGLSKVGQVEGRKLDYGSS